jgi:mannosyl-3-phosphoglycerate synthase
MVRICQIESPNPHLHADKGEDHVAAMIRGSLATIYHSRLSPPSLQEEIATELRQGGYLKEGETLAPVLAYPRMEQLDLGKFATVVQELVDRRVGAPSPVALLVP